VKKLSPLKVLLAVVGLAIGVVAVLALREATLSTHETVPGRGTALLVDADTKGAEPGQTLAEMVEAQLLGCRLEVSSDLRGPIEPLGDGRFRATLEPTLDETNERQFRGCVEDWVIDHLRVDVVDLHAIPER
jgi:hypothetical protein